MEFILLIKLYNDWNQESIGTYVWYLKFVPCHSSPPGAILSPGDKCSQIHALCGFPRTPEGGMTQEGDKRIRL